MNTCKRSASGSLAVTAVALLIAGCGQGGAAWVPPPTEVTTMTVQPRDVPIALQYVGQTESSRLVEIRARVDGYLQKKLYNEGVIVRQGDPLFQLDPKPLQAVADSAQAALLDRENQAQNARLTQERVKALLAENAVSKKDMDDANAAEKSAAAALAAVKAENMKAGINLANARVVAPLSGLAGRSALAEGTYITPGAMLTSVAQIDPIWVNFAISENEWLRYATEQKRGSLRLPKNYDFEVELILSDGQALPTRGRINFAAPAADPQTGTYAIRAVFPNADLVVRPGQFVRVRLNGAVRPGALLVPQRAVMQGQTGKFVYVVGADSKAEVRPVEVGDWHGENWFITSGLKGGEQVIVGGVVKVQPGALLKVVTEAAKPADGATPPGKTEAAKPAEPAKNEAKK